jgi:hypothetical protein
MRKAQAAMEYLMVFGFAIAAVLMVVGALAYFGVISPSKFMPERCVIGTGIRCVDFFIRDTTLIMKVENTLPKDQIIKRLELVSSSLANGRCNSDATTVLKPLAQTELQIPGCAFTSAGKKFGKLNVLYTGGQITHSLGGDIIIQVNSAYEMPGTSQVANGITNANALAEIDQRKIARDSNGNIYVTYTYDTSQMKVAKSSDGGKSWSVLGTFSICALSYYSSIAVDANDIIHVVWEDKLAGCPNNGRLRYGKYDGASWSTSDIYPGTLNVQEKPKISVGRDGSTLYVTWRGISCGGAAQARFAKSVNGGASWNIIDIGCNIDALNPTLAETTDGKLYIIATTTLPSVALRATSSVDGGASWSGYIPISSNGILVYPSLVIDSSNNLHVIWIEGNAIKYAKSSDGLSWAVSDILGTSGTPSSASLTIDSADNLYAVWVQGSDVWTSKYLWGSSGWTTPVQKTFVTTASRSSYRFSRYTANGALDMVFMNTTTGIAFLSEPFG